MQIELNMLGRVGVAKEEIHTSYWVRHRFSVPIVDMVAGDPWLVWYGYRLADYRKGLEASGTEVWVC
jgi:hypothetical protein